MAAAASDRGCYLTFTEENNGTLYTNWSESPVEGALMFFQPFKAVPAFKFKQNGGRNELARDAGGGVKVKNFFAAVAQFVKMAKQFVGRIRVDESAPAWPASTALYVCRGDGAVVRLEAGQLHPLDDADAVGCIRAENTDLNVERMAVQSFLVAANAAGAGIAL